MAETTPPAPPTSLFVPGGTSFIATELTRGPWNPAHQHGGPPSALLARAIEQNDPEGGWHVARLTYEFLRPVPLGRLRIETRPLKEGRTVQWVEAILSDERREVVRATALRIRRRSVRLPSPSEVDPRPVRGPESASGGSGQHGEPRPPLPEQCRPFEFPFFGTALGYHSAMEGRWVRGEFGAGPAASWFRMRYPLLPGESPSPLQRVAMVADSGNGISMMLNISQFTFVNPDLTIYLHRYPVGEWVCLDAATIPENLGVGLAVGTLFDEKGHIGRSLQSLVIEERAF
ncbi:MAG: thioesterase family protein [Nitrospirae bacterium]|nr:thioesterase family protein [Nitrospirota bacterium]